MSRYFTFIYSLFTYFYVFPSRCGALGHMEALPLKRPSPLADASHSRRNNSYRRRSYASGKYESLWQCYRHVLCRLRPKLLDPEIATSSSDLLDFRCSRHRMSSLKQAIRALHSRPRNVARNFRMSLPTQTKSAPPCGFLELYQRRQEMSDR